MSEIITGPTSSQTPYIVPTQDFVTVTSLLTVGDSPAGSLPWKMVGIPDGMGAWEGADGQLNIVLNHELGNTAGIVRDHGSKGAFVSLITFDPVTGAITSGDDLIQSPTDVHTWNGSAFVAGTTAWNRFCSGDLADPSAYYDVHTGLGTQERIFLTGEEAGDEGRGFAFVLTNVDGADGTTARTAWELPALGNFSYENAVASADAGAKTVVISLDDTAGGQIYVYVGDKKATGLAIDKAGLTGGDLFGIKVAGVTSETNATAIPTAGATFTLQEMGVAGDVSAMTGAALQAESVAEGVTGFLRPEDGAFDPTNPNLFYFVTTNGFNAPTRLWTLEFANIEDPTAGGTIKLLLDGSEGGQMFDNITVTDGGLVILQEDPGGVDHLAKIWLYDPKADQRTAENPAGETGLTLIAQHDPARFTPGTAGFLTRDEESSGVIDITSLVEDDTQLTFLVDVQAHYNIAGELVQGGQLLSMNLDLATAADATMVGTNGDDDLVGGNAKDVIDGDFGDDWIHGGNGDDHILGNYGDDQLWGGNGADRVEGGVGADKIWGENGQDRLWGNVGDDEIKGGNGDDWIDGGVNDDTLWGENGDDYLLGGFGDDDLFGGAGDDELDGGNGWDHLDGGKGDDLLTGGYGGDVFHFAKGSGADVVTDFELGIDVLALDGVTPKALAFADTDGDAQLDAVVSWNGGQVTLLGVSGVLLSDLFA